MKKRKYLLYLISILIPLAVGGIAAIFTVKGMPFYKTQRKPWFTPPDILFPIVWTILYILMGIVSAIIWKSDSPKKRPALKIYAIQLIVNFFWSVIFFGLHWYFIAFMWLIFLIILVIKMIKSFRSISSVAANLQIPYLLWCFFAAILNFSVWFLNR
ncbi:MAG: tryptophan-rich sensory protein [Bacteroidales bacterium]|nr:TspO/MBR family protein [Anaerotignum sp.]MCI5679688.1 tryptophan-rich sensory protein [Bacteroidales bacterium]MDY3925727.1 TspO/MBR family protein [Anaerotignum sp.]